MDVIEKPIAERIEWLFEHARRHSSAFRSPESQLSRSRYLARHPSAIAVLKCMDGRINIPVATNTPVGIITPFRNLGGMFDLGWPHLGEVLADFVRDTVRAGRRVLFVITYHYSKGVRERGCAGFNYDVEAARAHTCAIKRQVDATFGGANGPVYSVVCGFETDNDALVLHGRDGVLDMSDVKHGDSMSLDGQLGALFPDMPDDIRRDLLPIVAGNVAHIGEVRDARRDLDIEHREWMICMGRGFDFLHMPNLALIIGPYSPDLAAPIRTAAEIIEANMLAGRIPNDGFLLLASAPYSEIGMDRARAGMKAGFLSSFAAQVIASHRAALARKMIVRTAVLDWRSRALELIDNTGAQRQ
jgi:hypothetical protein